MFFWDMSIIKDGSGCTWLLKLWHSFLAKSDCWWYSCFFMWFDWLAVEIWNLKSENVYSFRSVVSTLLCLDLGIMGLPRILHPTFKRRHPLPFAIFVFGLILFAGCVSRREAGMLLLLQAGLSELWSFPHLTKSYLLQVRVSEKNRTNRGYVCECVCAHGCAY